MNQLKMHKKIEDYSPILPPYSSDIKMRIHYRNGQFQVVSADDKEAQNLIDFLGWNEPSSAQERESHVQRQLEMIGLFGWQDNLEKYQDYLQKHPIHCREYSTKREIRS